MRLVVENRHSEKVLEEETDQIKYCILLAFQIRWQQVEKNTIKPYLCTFSIAATSARAAKLKNADTAGISDVIL